ncbi:MAG: helix-turn-helix transcriptional regulator [Halioglobus sp.]
MKIDLQTPIETSLVELGRRLSVVRKQQGLNQDELASIAGLGVATVRRIEDGRDAQLGSWLKLLRALNLSHSVDALLPESLNSPMAEVKASGKKIANRPTGKAVWGDEL